MSNPNGIFPSGFGRYAGLPNQIWQTTDPGGEDFQRSFRSTLDFLNGVSGGVIQGALSNRALMDATGLQRRDLDPRAFPLMGVRQEAEKHGMARVMDWFGKLASPDGIDRNTYDDLIGQARTQGIADPESMNPHMLAQEVERKRTDRFLERFESMTPAKTIGNLALFEATGVAKSFVDIARDMPFVGDWISNFQTVRHADQWLSGAQEYYRTGYGNDPTDRLAASVATGIGYSAALYLAWQGLGAAAVRTGVAAAPLATRMPAIAKMALQGGTDAWILAGGGDKPLETRGIQILGGATLGGLAAANPSIAGAVLGGTAGAGLGYSLEGDKSDAAVGAAIGATLGIGVGALAAAQALRSRAQSSFPEPSVISYEPLTPYPTDYYEAVETPQLGSGVTSAPGPVRLLGPGEPIAAPAELAPSAPNTVLPPTAAVDVPGTTGLQVSRGTNFYDLGSVSTVEERALLETQRRAQAAIDAGMPMDPDAIGRHYEELIRQDPRTDAPLNTEGMNRRIPARDPLTGRFMSAKKGAAIAKQEAIMTSPALSELGQKPSFDDADVLKALQQTVPGQTVVVPDVQDMAGFEVRASTRGRELMREQGFNVDLPLYHGTTKAFEEPQGRMYFSPDPAYAGRYAERFMPSGEIPDPVTNEVEGFNVGTPNVRPAYIRMQRPLIVDEFVSNPKELEETVNSADSSQHDSVVFTNIPTTWGKSIYAALDPSHVRPQFWTPDELTFVQNPRGVTKAVVGDVTKAAQIASHGVFDGQSVRDASGAEGVAEQVGDFTRLRGVNGEESRLVRTEELMADPYSAEVPSLEGFYPAFKDYASTRMLEESADAGIDVAKLSWDSDSMSSQLPRYLDEYMTLNKIPASQRPGFVANVDRARMQDMMSLVHPAEREILSSMQRGINSELDNLTVNDEKHIYPTLLDYAATKGFDVQYGVGSEPRITLTHPNGEPHEFSLSQEAIDFLHEFHAADADLLPGGPGETGSPSGSMRDNGSVGANLTWEGAMDSAEETANVYERFAEGGGGGATPPPALPPSGGSYRLNPGGGFDDVAGQIQAQAKARTTEYLQTVSRVNSGFQRAWEPAIYRIMRLEEDLTGRMGVQGATAWSDVYNVSQADKQASSDAIEWGKKFDTAISGISRKHMRRGGGLFEIMEMAPEYQEGVMDMLGWKPAEKAAVPRFREFLDQIHGYARDQGVELGRLENYMPHLRQAFNGQRSVESLPEEIKWFAEELREGGIADLETDVSVVMGRYIRGMARQIHVKKPYEKAVALWGDKRIPDEVAFPVRQYLKDIYYGKTEVGSISLLTRDLVNTAGAPFGIKMTAQDVDTFTNFLLRMKYTNALGRMSSVMRNIPQPLWTASEIGVKGLQPFARFYTSPSYAREVMARAYEKGWVERGVVNIEHADVFRPAHTAESQGDPVLSPEDLARRGQIREAVNAVWDATPGNHLLSKAIDLPLKPFAGVGHINRAVAGQAGYDWAWDGIHKFDSTPNMTEDELLKYMNPGGTLARKPVINEFMRLLRNGQREEAASFMGSNTADNQLRYGFAEVPEMLRGDMGRLFMMFGRFSQQILRRYKDGMMAGTPSARMRFIGTQLVIAGMLHKAAEKTGMKGLMSYWWGGAIAFGGGPALEAASNIAQSVGAVGTLAGGGNLTYTQQQALTATGQYLNPVSGFNPYGGPSKDIEGLFGASQSDRPVSSAIGTLLTGRPPNVQQHGYPIDPNNVAPWLYGSQPDAYPDVNGVLNQRQQYGSGMLDTIVPVPGYPTPGSPNGGSGGRQ